MTSFQTSSKEVATTATSKHRNSRIPTKADAEPGYKSKGLQHVSRLAKKSGTINHVSVKSTSRTPTPVTEVGHKYGQDRRVSFTPATTTTPVPPSMRTPSLVSGSSASTFDSPRSNTLRRKPSSAIDRYAAQKRSDTEVLQLVIPGNLREVASRHCLDDSVFGIAPPATSQHVVPQPSTALTYESLRRRDPPRDHTPSTTGYALSATPSTRYADSPFSHAPTPSSASSYSSGFAATAYTTRSRSSTSATRDGIYTAGEGILDDSARSALLPVRESSTSSSNSTVRTAGELKSRQADRDLPEPASATTDKPHSLVPARSPARNKLRKEPATFAARKRTNQAPPELAHLNLTTPISSAPRRPSRDGTSTIPDVSSPSPVVHSDLPRHYTTYHKRTSSQELANSDVSPSVKSRFGFPTRSSSKNASPRIDSAISPPPTALRFRRGATPEIPSSADLTKEGSRAYRKDSPAVGTGPSPSKSPRFAFFSRKPKQEAKVVEKPRRLSTKGPVAGTGHEGYGRFGARGRSASNASSTGSRSPSSDSTLPAAHRPPTTRKNSGGSKDGPGLDDFLSGLLEPRILRGSGSTWSQSESVTDSMGTSVQPASSKSSLENVSAPSLLPSAIDSSSRQFAERPFSGRRTTSDSSDDDENNRKLGRHVHRSVFNPSQSPTRMPREKRAEAASGQGWMDNGQVGSYLASDVRMGSPLPSHAAHGAEGDWLRSPSAVTEGKPRRKWNFLQRAAASPQPKGKGRAQAHPQGAVPVVGTSSDAPVAHFAMVDSVEPVGLAEVERLVQDIETSQDEAQSTSQATPGNNAISKQRRASLLPVRSTRDHESASVRPAAPQSIPMSDQHIEQHAQHISAHPAYCNLTPHAPDTVQSNEHQLLVPAQVLPDQYELNSSVHTPDLSARSLSTPDDENGSPRRPRLSPIGRIPQVQSRRDRERKLPDHSFSRPFVQSQPRPSVKPPGSVYSQIRDMRSPTNTLPHQTPSQGVWDEAHIGHQLNGTTPDSAPAGALAADWQRSNTQRSEFMSISDRKDSQQSCVSSSSGNWSHPSWMSALMTQPPQQEDVWDEYDDLVDDSMYRNPVALSKLHPLGPPPTSELPAPPGFDVAPAVLSVPQQVSRFLQPSLSPMTPDTIYAWVNGYGDRSTIASMDGSGLLNPQRISAFRHSDASLLSPQHSSSALRSSMTSRHSRTSSLPESISREDQYEPSVDFSQDSSLTSIPEGLSHEKRHSSPLRYSAHVTGKWLSGGRTLFSPAANELRLATEARVLVIDGLSSDWSYSIAHTYPSAEVYDMTIGSKLSSSLGWDEGDSDLPKNHRPIRVTGFSSAFPFPKGFFNAVVLRFPTVTTEQAYLNCVSECKRVLRPGGYLEVATIDLDLVNMGGQTRKAVKGLKTRMQVHDPSVCMGNLSDVLLRTIGRKGFEGVQRVLVHVPTAGQVLSQDNGGSGSDSSGRPLWKRQTGHTTQKKPSFMDLLNDTQNLVPELGHRNDESITKMIAKVSRWWYSSCYEEALLPTDRSIWNERGLLRECQKQSTRFRLLVCHAQKPMQTRRRTVSV